MRLGTAKAVMNWMTLLIYLLAVCSFIDLRHCCSGHSHDEGEAHGDHGHAVDRSSVDVCFSNSMPLPNGLTWSQRHCCGQGLHGEDDRVALHAVNCQRSSEPSRVVTSLPSQDKAGYGQPESPQVHCRAGHTLFRASARSPALEFILTVTLLI